MRYVLRKLVTLLVTLFLVSLLAFLAFSVIPGDPAVLRLGVDATPEALEALRADMGLDRPLAVRYVEWLGDMVFGEMGEPFAHGLSVRELLGDRLMITGSLLVMSFLLALGIARWSLGDIATQGEEAWFFCLPSVSAHIERELTRVGRGGTRVTEIPLNQVPPPMRIREPLALTVSSLRLDALLAATFGLSREKAAGYIEGGLVSLNYAVCLKPAALLEPGDVFSLQGYGKAALKEVGGKTRKERLRVLVEKYR